MKLRSPSGKASELEREVLRLTRVLVSQHRACCMSAGDLFALYIYWEMHLEKLVLRKLADVLEGSPLHVNDERR